MINIKGLDKAKVLLALYDNSYVQGLGHLSAIDNFTIKDAKKLLKTQTYFDYLHGRILKVDLSGNEFDEWLYDKDNGIGAAQKAIDSIKIQEDVHVNANMKSKLLLTAVLSFCVGFIVGVIAMGWI